MLGILFLILLTTILFYNYWKRRNLPPGPTPLPLVGNILSIGLQKGPYDSFIKWRKQYGPIYTYWLGEKPIVAVSDFNLMKETFVKDGDSYTGRDFFTEFQTIFRGGKKTGIGDTDGELWKNQRRFMLHVFRNIGMGRNIIEDTIMKEVERLITYADESINSGKQEMDMMEIVELCVGSIINQILLGYRFVGETEQEFHHLKTLMTGYVDLMGHPLSLVMNTTYPKFWRHFPYFKALYNKLMGNVKGLFEFLDSQVAMNRKLFAVEGDVNEATNYVQAFLSEMHKRETNGDVGDFTIDQLRGMLFDLWIAGQDTTTTTLKFAFLYIMVHQNVQEKMHDELDKIIGNERRVFLADRQKLPYTNAVVHEVQRLCNLLPVNLFHKTTKDVIINGYKVDEGITIEPQLCVVLFDEKVFSNPEKFIPERFLDENGRFKKVDEFIPFSVGKRQCAGESLSRDELFLFISNLFHEFKLKPSQLREPPTLTKLTGFFVKPKPYMVDIKRRIPMIH